MDKVMLSDLAWAILMYEKDSKQEFYWDRNMERAFEDAHINKVKELGKDIWDEVLAIMI